MAAEPVEDPETGWREYGELQLHPVLLAALGAFAEHGYDGASVRDIARRVGFTVPAIYYHYESKQELLVSLLFGSIDDVLRRCRAALSEADPSPLSRLRHLTEAVVLYMAHRRDLAFLDSEIRSLEPENRRAYVAKRDELQRYLVDAVESGCEVGAFATPYPRDASRALLTMFQGVASWYRPDGRLRPEDVAERYVEFALSTVQVRQDA